MSVLAGSVTKRRPRGWTRVPGPSPPKASAPQMAFSWGAHVLPGCSIGLSMESLSPRAESRVPGSGTSAATFSRVEVLQEPSLGRGHQCIPPGTVSHSGCGSFRAQETFMQWDQCRRFYNFLMADNMKKIILSHRYLAFHAPLGDGASLSFFSSR